MYEPINWLEKHPESDIELKIFYFSLEISKEAKIRAAISHKLFTDYGITISPQKLLSVFKDYIYDEKVKTIVESETFINWLKRFEEIVEFNDTIRNPFGIFNVVKTFAEKNGHYSYKNMQFKTDQGLINTRVKDTYYPNNPNLYVIIIVDHISLLHAEKGQSLHQAMGKFSSEYCLYMRDKWGYIPTIVQQQSASSSSINQGGGSKKYAMELVKPDSEGLADNKYTARDVDLMLSLFNPAKYDIPTYKQWDLNLIGDSHRELTINLNRNGISNAAVQLYFNGASAYFSELPSTPNTGIYEDILRWEQQKL